MSLNDLPLEAEAMGWYPQSLAEYTRRDDESDLDYEGQHQEEGADGYICAPAELHTVEQQDSDETDEDAYELPSSADTVKPLQHPRVSERQDGHYRDSFHDPSPAGRTSRPPLPQPPRLNHTPPRPLKAPASQHNLHIDRSKKPGQSGPSQKNLTKSKGSTVQAPGPFTSKIPQPRTHKRTDVSSNRAVKQIRAPPVPTQPSKVNNPIPGPRKCNQGLDASWYGGRVTRHQAEVTLTELNKDGAFLVRDSSRGSAEHPYTLMLLKQNKVYNIKIRNQGNSYSLGTGLNNKSFPGVKEMITYHTHTPLLLIDATDQSSEDQSQCRLLHPAGL